MKVRGFALGVALLSGCTLIIEQGIKDADANRDGGGPGSDGGGTGSDGGGTGSDGGGPGMDSGGPTDAGFIVTPPCLIPDGGFGPITWSSAQMLSGTLYAAWAANDNDVWVAGEGVVSHFNGAWNAITNPSPAGITFYGVRGTAANDVWLVGSDGSSLPHVWHWNGSAVTPVTIDWTGMGISTATLYDVLPEPNETWIVGDLSGSALVLQYSNGVWSTDAGTSLGSLYAVASDLTGSGTVWAAGLNAAGSSADLYTYSQSQGTWAGVLSPGNVASFDAVWLASPTEGWVGGETSPSVYHLKNGTWAAEMDATVMQAYVYYHGIWGSGPNDVWLVSQAPAGLVDHWNGSTWTPNDISGTPCATNSWYAVTGSCHSIWFVDGLGDVCQGTR